MSKKRLELNLLKKDEIDAVIRGALKDGAKLTTEGINQCLTWAEQTRFSNELLNLVIEGRVIIAPDPSNSDDVLFKRVVDDDGESRLSRRMEKLQAERDAAELDDWEAE